MLYPDAPFEVDGSSVLSCVLMIHLRGLWDIRHLKSNALVQTMDTLINNGCKVLWYLVQILHKGRIIRNSIVDPGQRSLEGLNQNTMYA